MKWFVVVLLLTLAALFAVALVSVYADRVSEGTSGTPTVSWVEEVNIPPPGSNTGFVALVTDTDLPACICPIWSFAGDDTPNTSGGVGINDRLKTFCVVLDISPDDVLAISQAQYYA